MGRKREWAKEFWSHKWLIFISLIFLAISISLDYASSLYLKKISTVVVPDLILDHIPTIDLSFIFIYGAILVTSVFFLYPLFFKVKELHKAIAQFSLLIMVRSIFTTLTHLQEPILSITYHAPKFLFFFNVQNDLFFSGHTAIPFLGFLLFKDSEIKYFFLAMSVIMAITVLFMHAHYSIDVFSAFFITYGTFKIGEWFFKMIDRY